MKLADFIKKNICHFIIIIFFLIYLISASSIFNKILLVENESKPTSLILPRITNNLVKLEILGTITKKWKKLLRIQGFILCGDKMSDGYKSFVVLKSDDNTYIYTAMTDNRPDIMEAYKKYGSGFRSYIAKDVIKDGRYRVGIYIKGVSNNIFSFSNDYFTKNKNFFYKKFVACEKNMELPDESNDVKMNVENVSEIFDQGEKLIGIQGYAFVENQSSADNEYFILLQTAEKIYIFDAASIKRPDVAIAYNGNNLEDAGFEAYIPAKSLSEGKYRIGVLIQNNGFRHLQYTAKMLINSAN